MVFMMRSSVWCYERFPHRAFNFLGEDGRGAVFAAVYRLGIFVLFALPHVCIAIIGGWLWRFLRRSPKPLPPEERSEDP